MAKASGLSSTAGAVKAGRRLKVGTSGRLHLDRQLCFLVVHRLRAGREMATSLARRVALDSPTYLVWAEGDDDAEAVGVLRDLAAEIEAAGTRLLVMAVDDLDQPPAVENSQRLTPFVATVGSGGSGAELRAGRTLVSALERIEIDLRRAEVLEIAHAEPWLVTALAEAEPMPAWLRIDLPQLHLREDGGIFPQMAHELAIACGDALLRTACAYLDGDGDQAPAHYRALGRSAFLKAALNTDRKLAAICGSFDFLLSVSPINTGKALEQFIADGEQRAPQFHYRPLTVDPDATKRRLYALDFTRLEDPLLERLFTDKRHEIDAQLTMLATRNTPSFRAASLFLYGVVTADLLADARRVLDVTPRRGARGAAIGADEVATAARRLIGTYGRKDMAFDARVELRDDVSGLMVTANRLLIGSATTMPAARLDALLSHEVSTHLLTYLNGAAQGLSLFRSGLAHYEGIQEGLGVFAEWAVGGLSNVRMRLLAARVVAVDAMQRGAEFMDTYRLLRTELGFSTSGAFGIATRVHRSGGLAKDAIYLQGFRAVIDHVASGASLEPFWLGKIARGDVAAIEELLQRGLVRPPLFLPEYLDRPQARRRIEHLKSGVTLEQLFAETE
jgi:uncharacterized protein (TIGR02421 family)